MVNLEFLIEFYTFHGAFCVIYIRTVSDFLDRLIDNCSSLWLSITSTLWKSVPKNSPDSLSRYSDWFEAFELVLYVPVSYCSASDIRSDDIVLGIPFPLSVTVSFVHGSMQ